MLILVVIVFVESFVHPMDETPQGLNSAVQAGEHFRPIQNQRRCRRSECQFRWAAPQNLVTTLEGSFGPSSSGVLLVAGEMLHRLRHQPNAVVGCGASNVRFVGDGVMEAHVCEISGIRKA